MTILLLMGAMALTWTIIGTAMLRTRAASWGLMDVPNARSLHSRATPRGGGIVIVAVVMAGVAAAALAGWVPRDHAAAFAAAALLVAAIGWRDDIVSLSPGRRMLAHLIAAVGAMALWGTFDALDLPGIGLVKLSPAIAFVGTMLWLVGLLNAYNFMDGIDGIAAGQAVLAGIVWVLLSGAAVPLVTLTALLIATASLGFLVHNWSPARIFMGDAGSGFLGFSFALLPLMAYDATGDARLPVAGVLVVGPFVFDTTFTLVRRLLRRENVLLAHRTHLYQRLVTGGWPHATVSGLYLFLAAVCSAAALAWAWRAFEWTVILALTPVLLLPGLVAHVRCKMPGLN